MITQNRTTPKGQRRKSMALGLPCNLLQWASGDWTFFNFCYKLVCFRALHVLDMQGKAEVPEAVVSRTGCCTESSGQTLSHVLWLLLSLPQSIP